MKAIKGQLETSLTAMKRQNVFSSICRVFWPFQMQIVGRQFNVYVGRIKSMNEMGSAPEINAIDARMNELEKILQSLDEELDKIESIA